MSTTADKVWERAIERIDRISDVADETLSHNKRAYVLGFWYAVAVMNRAAKLKPSEERTPAP